VKGPPQDLTNGATNPNTSHETKNVKITVMVEIIFSFFDLCKFATTYAIIHPYFVRISLTCKTMTLYFMSRKFVLSKNPIVMGVIIVQITQHEP
jgi:hypothetical protein